VEALNCDRSLSATARHESGEQHATVARQARDQAVVELRIIGINVPAPVNQKPRAVRLFEAPWL